MYNKKKVYKSTPFSKKRKGKSVKKFPKIKKGKTKQRSPTKRKGKKIIKKVLKRGVKKKKPKQFVFAKSESPIIFPKPEHEWEAWQTFNPGVIQLNGKVHFLYRAVGEDWVSRFGYANSNDGFRLDERLPYPVYEHAKIEGSSFNFNIYSFLSGGSFMGVEDPRIVRVGDENRLYVTYTACENGLRVALTSISLNDFLNKKWNWKKMVMLSPPGEVHKNWVIFPEKIKDKYAILHSLSPIAISYFDNLEFDGSSFIKSPYHFQESNLKKWGIKGVGPPPIKTDYGWLVFFHLIERDESDKYKIGAMMLDYKDPTKIIWESREPVLEPETPPEINGVKSNIVYATGAIERNGQLFLYYGGSDNYVCVAVIPLNEFLKTMLKETKLSFKGKILKSRK